MTTITSRWLVGIATLGAFLLSACDGGGPAPTTAPVEVTITAREFAFDPQDIEVPAGVPVTIIFVNDGILQHDFTIDALNLSVPADPGQTVRETVTFGAGTYDVYCTVLGHHEAGMEATLTAS